jgi:hypothetical protein
VGVRAGTSMINAEKLADYGIFSALIIGAPRR